MPYFLHQWRYHDYKARQIVSECEDREQVVRDAAEQFGGELLQFFYCFGEYDAMAISRFPDNERLMACLLVLFGEGATQQIRTTPLIDPDESKRAIQAAHDVMKSELGDSSVPNAHVGL